VNERDEFFMQLALGHASLALKNNWIPVGAVIVYDGRVIAHGAKTGIAHVHFDHAEHNACYQALWSREGPRNLRGCTVYATLEPCLLCLSMLMTTRVSRIVYGLADPHGGGMFMLEHPEHLPARFQNERPEIVSNVLARESAALLREFFARPSDSRAWSNMDNPLVKLAMETV
jgi:tRNA(adenine34) deaminase